MTWRLPDLDSLNLDNPETTVIKRRIIQGKPFLKRLYRSFYDELLNLGKGAPPGPAVEFGSGPGFLKDLDPAVFASDVFCIPGLDLNFSAGHVPFKNNSLSCILMVDVFHHLPDPLAFLKEAERCLVRGGRVIMIEPFNSLFGRFVYRYLHQEPFEPEGDWNPRGEGPLSRANSALPWIIFSRDRKRFEQECPGMKIKTIRPHTPFAYLFSGGLSYRTLLPGFLFRPVRWMERVLSPFRTHLSMFGTICLEKK